MTVALTIPPPPVLLIKKPVSFEEVSLEEFTARLEGFGYPDSLALELAENMACYKDNPEMWVPPGNIKATEVRAALGSRFGNIQSFLTCPDP